jgi:putative copper export protein|tara:strand:- start:401 stop:880 length:480 start_codon:yes stop_codon:yes gene_type:complete
MILGTLLSINHWLHLSAAALLVGGMIFLVAILRPVLGRSSSISGLGKFSNDIHDRFRIYVGILIGVLIITGIINSIDSIMSVAETSLSSGYKTVIRIKVLLAVCLFIIYSVNAFLIKEDKTEEDCSCLVKPPVYKKILQVLALVLVFVILFLAASLRFY